MDNTCQMYLSVFIVHIGGNDLDKRDDCTELCIFKLIAFLTHIRQSCSVRKITVLKLIPRKVTRHICITDFNSRVVKANSLLKRQCVDVNFRYWRLRGFTNSSVNILSDGVHLNSHGLAKYFREIRGILLLQHRSLCLPYSHDFRCFWLSVLFCVSIFFYYVLYTFLFCVFCQYHSCFHVFLLIIYIMTPSFSSHLSIFTVTISWFWNRYTC